MSKAKFAAAKDLIDKKDYARARTILKGIDHPSARHWEAKLDKIAPKQRKVNIGLLLAVIIVVIVLVMGVVAMLMRNNSQQYEIAALPTAIVLPSITPTVTPSITPSPTATSTPTPTYTSTPTPTTTNTPLPTATITNTTRPTSTPNFASTQEKATLIAVSTQNTVRQIANSTAAAQQLEASLMVPGCPGILELDGSPLDFIERSNRIMLDHVATSSKEIKQQRQEIAKLPYIECLGTYRKYLLTSLDELALSHEYIELGNSDLAQEHLNKWNEYTNLYIEEMGMYFNNTMQ